MLEDVDWCNSAYEAVDGAHVTVLMTEWNAYRALDLKLLARRMAGNVLIDLRNVYQAADLEGSGLVYQSIGRPRLIAG